LWVVDGQNGYITTFERFSPKHQKRSTDEGLDEFLMEQKNIWNNLYFNSPHTLGSIEWIQKYDNYFHKMKNYTIIDLGCGRGDNAYYLKEEGYNVIACDFSPVAVEFINKTYPLIETKCFDMTKDFPKDFRNVGIVLASLSTHYFSLEETIVLYDNIYDTLQPTGYFIFRVNSKEELENKNRPDVHSIIERDYYLLNDGNTKRYFDIDSVSALLKKFSIIDIHQTQSEYRGHVKYYIEGMAQKNF